MNNIRSPANPIKTKMEFKNKDYEHADDQLITSLILLYNHLNTGHLRSKEIDEHGKIFKERMNELFNALSLWVW